MDVRCIKKHIFLTGEKGVGKSTLLNKILQQKQMRVGGFRTVKSKGHLDGKTSLHLLRADREDVPSADNFLCFCPPEDRAETTKRFDIMGSALLQEQGEVDLILMDEIGPAEADAKMFQAAVWQVLNGDVPVYGVLQKAETELFQKIKNHPNVLLIEITKQNRDCIQLDLQS